MMGELDHSAKSLAHPEDSQWVKYLQLICIMCHSPCATLSQFESDESWNMITPSGNKKLKTWALYSCSRWPLFHLFYVFLGT